MLLSWLKSLLSRDIEDSSDDALFLGDVHVGEFLQWLSIKEGKIKFPPTRTPGIEREVTSGISYAVQNNVNLWKEKSEPYLSALNKSKLMMTNCDHELTRKISSHENVLEAMAAGEVVYETLSCEDSLCVAKAISLIQKNTSSRQICFNYIPFELDNDYTKTHYAEITKEINIDGKAYVLKGSK
jgi:hypothetical protein